MNHSSKYTQCVPIPVSSYRCSRGNQCCTRSCIPLTLAYARTIHKFQGLSAGPVDEGKIPNPYDSIVCDPDKNSAEGNALGLLYTAVSRATTLGDDNGLNSAIYFQGKDFTRERLESLGRKKDSEDFFKRVLYRKAWVLHLQRNKKQIKLDKKKTKELVQWTKTTRYTYDDLFERTQTYLTAKLYEKHNQNSYKKKRKRE